jgi:hypothetical protein
MDKHAIEKSRVSNSRIHSFGHGFPIMPDPAICVLVTSNSRHWLRLWQTDIQGPEPISHSMIRRSTRTARWDVQSSVQDSGFQECVTSKWTCEWLRLGDPCEFVINRSPHSMNRCLDSAIFSGMTDSSCYACRHKWHVYSVARCHIVRHTRS